MTLEITPALVLGPLVAFASLALAAWLLYLNRSSPLHLTFAGFLLLRSIPLVGPAFAGHEAWDLAAGYASACAQIVIPFFVPIFLYNFQKCHCIAHAHTKAGFERFLTQFYLIAPWLLLVAFLFRPSLYAQDLRASMLHAPENVVGPLYAVNGLDLMAYALLALLFAREVFEATGPVHRASYIAVAQGFGITAAFETIARPLMIWNGMGGPLSETWPRMVVTVWCVVASLILLRLAMEFRRNLFRNEDPALRTLGKPFLPFLSASVLAAILVAAAFATRPALGATVHASFSAAAALALPVFVSYAILRHRLFDIDIHFRATVRRGTVAAVFVAVFFAASEGTQFILEERWGPTAGILATAVLMLFLAPLQRRAEQFAEAAVPAAPPLDKWQADERARFYREQVHIAWGDGSINAKERLLLESLRSRIGLSLEEAHQIEQVAIAEHWLKRPSQQASTA